MVRRLNDGISTEALERATFVQALCEHRDDVLRYLSRHILADLRRIIEPVDILQDAFYEASNRMKEFCQFDEATRSRWITTIARNCLIDMIRKYHAAKRGGGISPEEAVHSSVIASLAE